MKKERKEWLRQKAWEEMVEPLPKHRRGDAQAFLDSLEPRTIEELLGLRKRLSPEEAANGLLCFFASISDETLSALRERGATKAAAQAEKLRAMARERYDVTPPCSPETDSERERLCEVVHALRMQLARVERIWKRLRAAKSRLSVSIRAIESLGKRKPTGAMRQLSRSAKALHQLEEAETRFAAENLELVEFGDDGLLAERHSIWSRFPSLQPEKTVTTSQSAEATPMDREDIAPFEVVVLEQLPEDETRTAGAIGTPDLDIIQLLTDFASNDNS